MTNANSNELVPNRQNEVAEISASNFGAVDSYHSPFMQIRSIAELKTAAQVFASSDFAPKQFQGNVGNCMVALDMANQMGMNVLTLMQQLYIIDGRPAVSTALANSLFNMAQGKKYSTIRLERGVEGTVEYDVMVKEKDSRGYTTYRPSGKKKTLPNYWAVAYTTNLKTGERFESPKVSVKTALENGWLTKFQSKWQTLPELMCGYRAEAFLIRTYFPQVLLGMYFQDEVEDIVADSAKQVDVEVMTPQPKQAIPAAQPAAQIADTTSEETATVEALEKEMIAAQTIDELKAAGAKVRNFALSPQSKDKLRALYHKRNNELAAPQTVEVEEVAEEPVVEVVTEEETAPRRTRAPKATPTRTADFDPNDFVVSVQNATSEAELSALRNALKTEEKAGRVTSDVAEQLSRVIENRYVDFENTAPQVAGTVSASDQEANVYDLIKEVKSQANEEGLRRVVGKASAWRSSGDITDDGFKRVVEVAEKRRGEVNA